MVREIRGLKCPHHEYVRDNHHFMYQEAYPGARPHSGTRCIKCGYTMSLHKAQRWRFGCEPSFYQYADAACRTNKRILIDWWYLPSRCMWINQWRQWWTVLALLHSTALSVRWWMAIWSNVNSVSIVLDWATRMCMMLARRLAASSESQCRAWYWIWPR